MYMIRKKNINGIVQQCLKKCILFVYVETSQ